MRTFLLVIFEVVALIGIPRMIHELRAALGEKAPPVLMAATSTNEQQPFPVSSPPPAKAALTDELEKAQLLKDSLPPSARTVANLQEVPQALIPAKESPVRENAAAPRDDDYLPPWMRDAGGVKREASPAPSAIASAHAPAAAKTPAKQIRHRRRRDGLEAYAANPRRARNRRLSLLGF